MEERGTKNQQKRVGHGDGFPEEKGSQFSAEEGVFQFFHKKIVIKRKLFRVFAITFVGVAIIGASFVLYFRNKNNSQPTVPQKEIVVDLPKNAEHVFVNDSGSVSVGEKQDDNAQDLRGFLGTSENYRIKDIAFGGGTMVLAAETDNLPITISDVRTETMFSRDGKEMKLLLSWKSNKLSRAEVRYVKDGGSAEKVLQEEGYGFSHALVLNKLEQSSRYSFTVEARDRQGNKTKSDTFVVYMGTKPASVFELISKEVDEIFGWVVKE